MKDSPLPTILPVTSVTVTELLTSDGSPTFDEETKLAKRGINRA